MKQPSVPFLWTVTFALVVAVGSLALGWSLRGLAQPKEPAQRRFFLDSHPVPTEANGESGWVSVRWLVDDAPYPLQIQIRAEDLDRVTRWISEGR